MRFLADESCDFHVVRALRAAGHDVAAANSIVIERSIRESRIVVTEDRDFGRLVYASAIPAHGVILLRYPTSMRATLPAAVVDFVAGRGDQIAGRFVVIEPGRARIGRTP